MSQKHLEVKDSKIKGAGKGLFTKVPIKKGQFISRFTGELIEIESLKGGENILYCIEWDEKYFLNVEHSNCFAKYANDAEGRKRIKGLRNNSEICWRKNDLFLRAIKDISEGDEIYASYGKEYWENL